MKKTILYIGTILFILNSLFGLIISSYNQINIILVDINLLLTIGLIYLVFESQISDGFRIGLSFLYSISGFIRILLALFSNIDAKDNMALIFLLLVLAFELTCFVGSKFLNTK
jgi:hypothetical protein